MDDKQQQAWDTTFVYEVSDALKMLGLKDTQNAREMLCVFTYALKVHQDRDKRYGQGWKERGWLGNVADVIRKADRIRSMFWDSTQHDPADDLDDLYDLINYCAFTIRNASHGNRTGRT